MKSESDSEWFLKDKVGINGPLSEADMRKHVDRSTDDELVIRQGNSDWRSVEVIRTKIRQLQENGIFVRYKSVAEGPFTLTRAHDVLKRMTPGGIDVRTGAQGRWTPADKWLSTIDKLLKVESKEIDSLSVAVQHVLGRKGFVGSTQNSDELDLAEADKEAEPAPTKPDTTTERPLWLSPEPITQAVPTSAPGPPPALGPRSVTGAIPVAELISEPALVHRAKRRRQAEPVIEVVKVMHTAEIAGRAAIATDATTANTNHTTNTTNATANKLALATNEQTDHKPLPALPTGTTIRARPRNSTSQKNRTRTSQEKLIIGGLSAAVACVLAFAGWNWAADTGTIVAQAKPKGELQTTRDILSAENGRQFETDNQRLELTEPTDPTTTTPNEMVSGTSETSPAKQPSDEQPVAKDTVAQTPEKQESVSESSTKTKPARGKSILAPLTISTGTLFHPRFGTSEGEVNAGTAFAAKLTGKSQILIVSALHLFGPAGGLKTNIQADKLTTAWKKLVVEDCKSRNYFGEIQMQPINLSGARPHPQKSAIGDIAACTVTDATAIKALPLSQRIPSNGERVWLVSKLPGSRELLHPATVERLDDGWLLYSFPDRSINLQSTSGAPIIDHKGQVVAVNASNAIKDGKTIGYGTPVVNFYPTLAALVQ
ncbi:serine protease [Rhodopirellula sp.]|nr:serine protease [Rhodopirellula sp.]